MEFHSDSFLPCHARSATVEWAYGCASCIPFQFTTIYLGIPLVPWVCIDAYAWVWAGRWSVTDFWVLLLKVAPVHALWNFSYSDGASHSIQMEIIHFSIREEQ